MSSLYDLGMTFPSLTSYILSQFLIVESLCAIIIIVLFPLRPFIAFIISSSVSLSRAEVASSSTKISGLRYRALAIPILCLCPPESLVPLSPTSVYIPFGNDSINILSWASSMAFHTCSSSISFSSIPNAILFRIVSSVKYMLCGIYPIKLPRFPL